MEKLKLDKVSLKQFGKKSAIGFAVLALIFFLLKKKAYLYFGIAAGSFGVLTFIAPRVLKYVYIASMRIAEPISWVMSKVIFAIFFFLIITPIGLFLKLLGKDLLNCRIDKNSTSYWLKKEVKPYDKAHFEKQF